MAAVKKPRNYATTPKGIFKYPKVNAIDYGSTQYPNPKGGFSAKVIVDKSSPELAAFRATLAPFIAQAKEAAELAFSALPVAERKKLKEIKLREPIAEMYDETTEELLNTVMISAKCMSGGVIGQGPNMGKLWFNRPKAFDRMGTPIPLFIDAPNTPEHGKPDPKAPRIWGGTLGRLSLEIDTNKDGSVGYFVAGDATYGIRLTLRGVQVLRLGDAPAANASQYGFTADEDEGYEYDADAYVAPAPAPAGTAADVPGSGDF